MLDLPILDVSGLLRVIVAASRAALNGFATFGIYLATPWATVLLQRWPAFYDFVLSAEAYILQTPVLGHWIRSFYWLYGIDSALDLTFLNISFGALAAFMIWRFITWIFNIIT